VVVNSAVVDDEKIYFVAGDVSDDGKFSGFYNAAGKTIALAYEGQGEHPDADAVDWRTVP
jgi:hypothetical protein